MSTPRPASSSPSWSHCAHGAHPGDPVGCRGIHVPDRTACLAHLTNTDRETYLAGLTPGADIDHRGTPFTEDLLNRLLNAVRDPAITHPVGLQRADEVLRGGLGAGVAEVEDAGVVEGDAAEPETDEVGSAGGDVGEVCLGVGDGGGTPAVLVRPRAVVLRSPDLAVCDPPGAGAVAYSRA